MESKGDQEASGEKPFYLGIDAGQTHLELALLNEAGELLARGTGGPSHIQNRDMKVVFTESLAAALDAIGRDVPGGPGLCIGVGISGMKIPGKQDAIRASLRELFGESPVTMDNDAVVSFWGAAGGGDGAMLLAGTGSIAYGRHCGAEGRVGGDGYLFGDEGAGFWIGRAAIQAAIRAEEGRQPETSLTGLLCDYFQLERAKLIPPLLYGAGFMDVKRIAMLAEPVCRHAEDGDSAAVKIVETAGLQLAELAVGLLNLLKVPPGSQFPLYRLGGIWRAGERLHRPFWKLLSSFYPEVLLRNPLHKPAVGAALMAKERQSDAGGLNDK